MRIRANTITDTSCPNSGESAATVPTPDPPPPAPLLGARYYPASSNSLMSDLIYIPGRDFRNLNRRARFTSGEERDSRIVCRHLALLVGMMRNREYREGKPAGRQADKRSFVHTLSEKLGSEEAISKIVSDFKIDEKLSRAVTDKTREGAFLAPADWSYYMATQFAKMGEEDNRQILVWTRGCVFAQRFSPRSGHAMTLGLRTKRGEDKRIKYVATLYDPNVTCNHLRLVANSLEEVRHASLDWFIDKPTQHWYGAELIHCIRIPDDPHRLLGHTDQEITAKLGPAHYEITPNLDVRRRTPFWGQTLLHLEVESGRVAAVKALLKHPHVRPKAMNSAGFTPRGWARDLAKQRPNDEAFLEIVKALSEHPAYGAPPGSTPIRKIGWLLKFVGVSFVSTYLRLPLHGLLWAGHKLSAAKKVF